MQSFLAFSALAIVLGLCNLSAGEGQDTGTVPQSGPSQPRATVQPTPDRDAVRSELLGLVNDMTEAARNGDISFLSQNTTEDFELTGVDGKVQNKNKALADVKEEKSIRSWAITDPELVSLADDSAVFRYTLNVTMKTGQSGRARITDSFVRQNGRWMLKSEQETMLR
ncbi:MAG TPA: hypothetical protein DEA22_02445 [Blastocatellia bacterium]|nr:hypothetical protein [Blastocatellia bacterium]